MDVESGRNTAHSVDTEALRLRFPALSRCTYLNTAGGAPIPDVAFAASQAYYEESFRDGDVHWNEWLDRTQAARRVVGTLIGARAEHVGFVGNASVGLNLAAQLDTPGRFAFPESEFPSCTLPWLRRGFEPRPWKVADDGSFDLDDVGAALESGSKVVVVSWVQFTSGFRADLAGLASLCQRFGVRLVVDGTQGIGAFPIDATRLGLDVLVFSGYKWMTSGYGVAGLVLPKGFSSTGSPMAGWRSQTDPHALIADRLDPSTSGLASEAGHPPFPGAFALGASTNLWLDHGPTNTASHILGLVERLHGHLDQFGVRRLSDRRPEHASGIVLLDVAEPKRVAERLLEAGILTSARRGGLRVSIHAYNTEDEIEGLVAALREILDR